MMMRKSLDRRRGQALVEGALVLFVFLAFIIGTLDFGQFLYFHQSLTERARAAARYGAVNPTDRIGIQNVAVYNDRAGAANGATPLISNFTTDMVSVCLPGDKSCSNSSTGPDWRITVTISGYRMITFNLLMPQSFTNQPITASLVSEAPFS
jgi:Flp pilus assembly protein TadG